MLVPAINYIDQLQIQSQQQQLVINHKQDNNDVDKTITNSSLNKQNQSYGSRDFSQGSKDQKQQKQQQSQDQSQSSSQSSSQQLQKEQLLENSNSWNSFVQNSILDSIQLSQDRNSLLVSQRSNKAINYNQDVNQSFSLQPFLKQQGKQQLYHKYLNYSVSINHQTCKHQINFDYETKSLNFSNGKVNQRIPTFQQLCAQFKQQIKQRLRVGGNDKRKFTQFHEDINFNDIFKHQQSFVYMANKRQNNDKLTQQNYQSPQNQLSSSELAFLLQFQTQQYNCDDQLQFIDQSVIKPLGQYEELFQNDTQYFLTHRRHPKQQNKKKNFQHDDQCYICQKYIQKNQLKMTNCNHSYHQFCIDMWLIQHKSCPICANRLNNQSLLILQSEQYHHNFQKSQQDPNQTLKNILNCVETQFILKDLSFLYNQENEQNQHQQQQRNNLNQNNNPTKNGQNINTSSAQQQILQEESKQSDQKLYQDQPLYTQYLSFQISNKQSGSSDSQNQQYEKFRQKMQQLD